MSTKVVSTDSRSSLFRHSVDNRAKLRRKSVDISVGMTVSADADFSFAILRRYFAVSGHILQVQPQFFFAQTNALVIYNTYAKINFNSVKVTEDSL